MRNPITMKERVELYLNHYHRLGYNSSGIKSGLFTFADYVDKKGYTGPLTIDLAIEWATASKQKKPSTWAGRLALIRGFAKYCKVIEPETEIPPSNIYGSTGRRKKIPHIYSEKEILYLLEATKKLEPINGLR